MIFSKVIDTVYFYIRKLCIISVIHSSNSFFLWLYEKTWTNVEATVITVTKMEYVQTHMEVIAVSVPTDTVATDELA